MAEIGARVCVRIWDLGGLGEMQLSFKESKSVLYGLSDLRSNVEQVWNMFNCIQLNDDRLNVLKIQATIARMFCVINLLIDLLLF